MFQIMWGFLKYITLPINTEAWVDIIKRDSLQLLRQDMCAPGARCWGEKHISLKMEACSSAISSVQRHGVRDDHLSQLVSLCQPVCVFQVSAMFWVKKRIFFTFRLRIRNYDTVKFKLSLFPAIEDKKWLQIRKRFTVTIQLCPSAKAT